MSEIVSVGSGYVNETGGSCVTDILMERTAREAYARGYRAGQKNPRDDWQFYLGVAFATIIWVALTLAVRWLDGRP